MPDLGPYDVDVPFAWDAASRLKHSFLRAASELEDQIPRRNAYAAHAMRDWRGRYAEEFEGEHMAVTARDAHRIAGWLHPHGELRLVHARLSRSSS
jgi:hypothetical protein